MFKYDVGSTKYYLFDFEDIKKNQNELIKFVSIFSKERIEGGFIEDLYDKSIIEEREFILHKLIQDEIRIYSNDL